MPTITSRDGTNIVYERSGAGPALILVDGATQTRAAGSRPAVVRILAGEFSVYSYDRRGRGDSVDTQPYAVEREIDDIAASIQAAGGAAHLYGHSSGACLALLAAAELGDRILSLAMYEPPYHTGPDGQRRWGTYINELTDALAGGRHGDAMALFFAYVGMPTTQIEQMRQAPFWAGLEALARLSPTITPPSSEATRPCPSSPPDAFRYPVW
jgi:pimeloyl-ACP methyl ester carboxylesterase